MGRVSVSSSGEKENGKKMTGIKLLTVSVLFSFSFLVFCGWEKKREELHFGVYKVFLTKIFLFSHKLLELDYVFIYEI